MGIGLIIEQLKKECHKVIMVGDEINDSPALAAANVSNMTINAKRMEPCLNKK